jgi:transcriptional regulator with XRE-family HTH domain
VPQIAAELGGRSTSTIYDWVRGIPPPPWTLRPQAKDAERARARELRAQGLTYGEIAEELAVSKSSVSLWTRDLPHPERSAQDTDARLAGLRRYFELRREREDLARIAYVESVSEGIGALSERELLIAGAVAYWAEGTKRKPWRPTERVTFTNSDVDMIRLFLTFLRLMDVADERVQLRVAIHESADEERARTFWAAVAGVSPTSFQRSTLKRHVVPTVRKNVGVDYHGCLVVTVLRSATLYRQIEGIWFAVRDAAGDSLGCQSRFV